MNRSAGYTLIEVLIMLAVTAILAATVLETVRASTANGIRIEQAARTATQDYITLASVRRAVEASRADYRDGENAFEGDETRFSALTSEPVSINQAKIRPYSLMLQNDDQGARLVYQEQEERVVIRFWPGGSGQWSYYGEEAERDLALNLPINEPRSRTWLSEWPVQSLAAAPSANSYYEPLPLAIRAEIDMPDGETEIMVFHLPITAAPRPRVEDIIGFVQ